MTLEPEFIACSTHLYQGDGNPECLDDLQNIVQSVIGETITPKNGEVYYLADTGPGGKVLIGIQTGFVCDNIDTSNWFGGQGPTDGDHIHNCHDAYDYDRPSRKYNSLTQPLA